MGELSSLAKARRELEEIYLGVPDESVNLTFKDFAELKQNGVSAEKKKPNNLDPIHELVMNSTTEGSAMGKSPSIDFKKGLQAARTRSPNHQLERKSPEPIRGHQYVDGDAYRDHRHSSISPTSSRRNSTCLRNTMESSLAYDDISVASRSPYQEKSSGGRRRAGIPHSNICTICSIYIYIFRHRCLVCGRVYCRQCLSVGMGEMTEGRKCIECLGRRYNQRYIQRAGTIGCCARYPSMVKQQELKWAELGPRRSGERGYSPSGMMQQRSRSPIKPRTPTRAHVSSSPPSFVMTSPYSQYSPSHHAIPF